jgi:hypothetical protein
MLTLVNTAAGETTFVQYDFENILPNQGVGVPAPPSYVNPLVSASDLGIVKGSGVALLNDPFRDGVVVGPSSQQISFQQGIPNWNHVAPNLYNFFEFDMAAVLSPVEITSISFLTGHNDVDSPMAHEGIIEYRSLGGTLIGSDTFDIEFTLGLAPVSIIPSTTLVIGTDPTFFNIRFNEEVYGPNSWTVQLRLDDVGLCGNVIPAPGAILLGSIGVGLVGWLRRRRTL